MTWPRPSAAPKHRERRLEVERRLSAHGLIRGPRRLDAVFPRRRGDATGEDFAPRLRDALGELGGGFAAFGRHLSLRADLLTARDCQILAGIPDGPSEPVSEPVSGPVLERLAEELGAPPEELFATFDPIPCNVHHLERSWRAWLRGGGQVLVRMADPVVEAAVRHDVELLPILARAFPYARFPLEEVIEGFRGDLELRLDFGLRARALEFAAAEADVGGIAVPRVETRLSTPCLLVTEHLGGRPLLELDAAEPGRPSHSGELARRLLLLWLHHTLDGRFMPLEIEAERLGDGRLAWTDGVFTDAPGASQDALQAYLEATAAHDVERTCCLLEDGLIEADDRAPGELHKSLRQIVPRRDGCLSLDGEGLADHLLLHWHLLRGAGVRPKAPLASFYRGLFAVARTAHALTGPTDAAHDPLRDALDDHRWHGEWRRWSRLGDPRQMAATAESYLALFSTLPQRFERLVDDPRPTAVAASVPAAPSRRDRVIAIVLALVACVAVADKLSSVATADGRMWIERIGFFVFLTLGALLLRAVGSQPRTPNP